MSEAHFAAHLLPDRQNDTADNRALFAACSAGDIHEVRRLLDVEGVSPDFFVHPEDHKNALHVAAEKGFDDIVQLLLQSHHGRPGASVDALAAASQNTPLIFAAQNNHLAVVRILLEHHAKVNIGNGYGNTALHEASKEGHLEVVKALLAAGADPNQPNHKGSTSLHFACYGDSRHAHPVEIPRALIASGAHVNARDKHGMTPILVCCSSGRADIITVLRSAGGDITARNNEGSDGHDIAVFYGREFIAQHFNQDSPAKRFA